MSPLLSLSMPAKELPGDQHIGSPPTYWHRTDGRLADKPGISPTIAPLQPLQRGDHFLGHRHRECRAHRHFQRRPTPGSCTGVRPPVSAGGGVPGFRDRRTRRHQLRAGQPAKRHVPSTEPIQSLSIPLALPGTDHSEPQRLPPQMFSTAAQLISCHIPATRLVLTICQACGL